MAVLRLDPRYPLVWRSPTAMQLGGRHPLVVLDPVTPTEEQMLSALDRGIPVASLAAQARCSASEAAAFVERLAPVLRAGGAPPAPPIRVRARDEQGRRVAELARSLGLLGPSAEPGGPSDAEHRGRAHTRPAPVSVAPPDASPRAAAGSWRDAGIAIGAHAIPPAAVRDWLRADVPHVGVVFAETEVRISHVVLPGRTPCLRCAELHQRDADPCWPAVAAQLVTRRAAAAEDPLLRLAGVVTAVRRLRAAAGGHPVATGTLRVATDGTTARAEAPPHPECGCLVDLQRPARPAA